MSKQIKVLSVLLFAAAAVFAVFYFLKTVEPAATVKNQISGINKKINEKVVFAVFYFLKTVEPAATVNNQISGINKKINETKEKIDLGRVKAEYKNDVNSILSDYSNLIKADNFTAAQVESIKKRLLGLNVPPIFKDLHVNLVLAVNKMENFLSNGDNEDKFFSQEMIDKNKEKYNWLK